MNGEAEPPEGGSSKQGKKKSAPNEEPVRRPTDERLRLAQEASSIMKALAGESEAVGETSAHAPRRPSEGDPKLTAAQAAAAAKTLLSELIDLEIDSVSEVSKSEDGWRIVVNLVELRRVPDSTDVIASYEVLLNDAGDLVGYHRERRYRRDQIGSEL